MLAGPSGAELGCGDASPAPRRHGHGESSVYATAKQKNGNKRKAGGSWMGGEVGRAAGVLGNITPGGDGLSGWWPEGSSPRPTGAGRWKRCRAPAERSESIWAFSLAQPQY